MAYGKRNALRFTRADIWGSIDSPFSVANPQIRRNRKKTRKSRKMVKSNTRKSSRKIKYTKNGQPYVIQRNGRAKFIKGRRHKK